MKRVLSVLVLATALGGCNSDDVKEVFKEIGIGGGLTTNASVCFNEGLYKNGTEYILTRRVGEGSNVKTNFEVMRDIYRGGDAILIRSKKETSADVTNTYVGIDINEKSHFVLGRITPRNRTDYKPALLSVFDLNKGESYSQTVTRFDSDSDSDSDSVYDRTITFKGFETVTVPAGEFKACKFESDIFVTKNNGLRERIRLETWYAVEYGVQLKEIENGVITTLINAFINGVEM